MAPPLPTVNRSCILCIWRRGHGERKGRKRKPSQILGYGRGAHKNSYTCGSGFPSSLSKEEDRTKNKTHNFVGKTKNKLVSAKHSISPY